MDEWPMRMFATVAVDVSSRMNVQQVKSSATWHVAKNGRVADDYQSHTYHWMHESEIH